ncbi:hypothetical protein J8273_1050 [Carpediemonas membranifera]|uniref:Uncharacterized protein n=1 Tax=Carpediemonas membranifera TaxID=201153 RepID=A0A8J6AXA1_9EUKA|nr:hypothetical protein J8273_1050 [Carpediemonas membranifera]|eukprot:KAG9397141.1 hypothetical protein J8273_1050 [Carpediemonas membranifera]
MLFRRRPKDLFRLRDGAAFKLICVDHRMLSVNKSGNISLKNRILTSKGKTTLMLQSTGQDNFYHIVHPPTGAYLFAKGRRIRAKKIKPEKRGKYKKRAEHVWRLAPIEGGTWAVQSARSAKYMGVVNGKLTLSDFVTMSAESWEVKTVEPTGKKKAPTKHPKPANMPQPVPSGLTMQPVRQVMPSPHQPMMMMGGGGMVMPFMPMQPSGSPMYR